MFPRATFATLRQILLDLGFTEKATPEEHVWFVRAKPDTRFLMPWYRPDEPVDPANLGEVRFMLDARGLLARDEFDRLLAEKALAG